MLQLPAGRRHVIVGGELHGFACTKVVALGECPTATGADEIEHQARYALAAVSVPEPGILAVIQHVVIEAVR